MIVPPQKEVLIMPLQADLQHLAGEVGHLGSRRGPGSRLWGRTGRGTSCWTSISSLTSPWSTSLLDIITINVVSINITTLVNARYEDIIVEARKRSLSRGPNSRMGSRTSSTLDFRSSQAEFPSNGGSKVDINSVRSSIGASTRSVAGDLEMPKV